MFPLLRNGTNHSGFIPLWLVLLITALPVTLYFVFGAAPELFVFDRSAIIQGEYWRLITGHWVHSDGQHAFWDIAALGLLAFVLPNRSRSLLLLALSAGMLGVDIWLWLGRPRLDFYCGLSGILNTVLVVVLYELWQKSGSRLAWLVAVGAIVKTIIEISLGDALLTQTAWPSVPQVHAVGLLVGALLIGWFLQPGTKRHLRKSNSIRNP